MNKLLLPPQSGVSPDPQDTRRDFLAKFTFTCVTVEASSLLATERLPKVPVGTKNPAQSKQEPAQLSAGLIALVKDFEGLRLTAYRCPAGVLTIGFGHTGDVKEGDTLKDVKAAEDLLRKDLRKHSQVVRSVFKDASLTADQIEALTSADFNCACLKGGKSGLAKFLQQKLQQLNDATDVADRQKLLVDSVSYLCRYNRSNGRFVDGLLRRRLSEGLLLAGADNPVVSDALYDKLKAQVLKASGQKGAKIESHIPEMVRVVFKKRGIVD